MTKVWDARKTMVVMLMLMVLMVLMMLMAARYAGLVGGR